MADNEIEVEVVFLGVVELATGGQGCRFIPLSALETATDIHDAIGKSSVFGKPKGKLRYAIGNRYSTKAELYEDGRLNKMYQGDTLRWCGRVNNTIVKEFEARAEADAQRDRIKKQESEARTTPLIMDDIQNLRARYSALGWDQQDAFISAVNRLIRKRF